MMMMAEELKDRRCLMVLPPVLLSYVEMRRDETKAVAVSYDGIEFITGGFRNYLNPIVGR